MAAFSNTHNSAVYDRQTGVLKADPLDGAGQVKRAYFTYTQPTGDNGTGTIQLGVLPAGLLRILPDNSRLVTSQFGASATISIGYAAYVSGTTGLTVSASTAALHSAGAAGAGALDVALGAPADGSKGLELNSRDGVTIIATIASGDIEAADTIGLGLEYVVIGG